MFILLDYFSYILVFVGGKMRLFWELLKFLDSIGVSKILLWLLVRGGEDEVEEEEVVIILLGLVMGGGFCIGGMIFLVLRIYLKVLRILVVMVWKLDTNSILKYIWLLMFG